MTFKIIAPPATIEVDSAWSKEEAGGADANKKSKKNNAEANVVKATMNTLPRGEVLRIVSTIKEQFSKLESVALDTFFSTGDFFTGPDGYVCNLLKKLLVSWDIEKEDEYYIIDAENIETFCANYPDHACALVINYMIEMERIFAKN